MALSFHRHVLPNALTLVAEVNPDAHTAGVGFFVNTGSRDEDPALMGVSHFLEHMMFKGTARRSADDVNREFDEIGADYNAYTSQENTVYYAHVLPEFIPRATDLLADMMRPALRAEDFNVEKKVILEEIGMYEDRPQWRLQDQTVESFYADHTLGHRVLGTAATVSALTPEQMRGYFDQRYGPDNIVVAAAGRIDFDALVRDVEKLTASWSPRRSARLYREPGVAPRDLGLADPKVNRHYLCMMAPAPSAQDPRRYAARILCDVLGDSDGSRLYWALIDPGLADEADLSFVPQDQTGAYCAFVSCDPHRAAAVEKTLLATLDDYVRNIDPAELERAKNKLATSTTLQGENPGGRMRALGSQWLYNAEYHPLEHELAQIMAVTPADLRDLLKAFPFTPRTVVRLGPKA